MNHVVVAVLFLSLGDALTTIPETTSTRTVSSTFSNNEFRFNRRHFLAWTATAAAAVPSYAANALTPQEASRQYDTYASSYNKLDGGQASTVLGIEDARRELIQKAAGHVLEIGVGTGTHILESK